MSKILWLFIIFINCNNVDFEYSFTLDQIDIVEQPKIKTTSIDGNKYLLLDNTLSKVELAILLVEYSENTLKNKNPGNLRNRDLTYRKYKTMSEGLKAFTSLIRDEKGKYNRCLNLPIDQCVECIAERYSEDPKEWIRRVKIRLKQIY